MLGETTGSLGPTSGEVIPAAVTDVGCEREINEDRYAVIDSPHGKVWVVCDGMGGSMGGELAAQLAIDAIRRSLESRDFESPADAVKHAIQEANRVIVLRRQNPAFSSMGTTIVAALVSGPEVIIAHAGDSRAYLVRDGLIEQLTVDHTYVQDLVERGSITQEEALSHPQAHVLTKCLGADPRLSLDWSQFWTWTAEDDSTPKDLLILASDGLYSLIDPDEIARSVGSRTPQESCVELVELAKARGGYDNITIAILPIPGQLRDEQPPSARAVKPVATKPKKKKQSGPGLFSGFTLGKRLLLMTLLFFIGTIATAMILGLLMF